MAVAPDSDRRLEDSVRRSRAAGEWLRGYLEGALAAGESVETLIRRLELAYVHIRDEGDDDLLDALTGGLDFLTGWSVDSVRRSA